jgi:hypothetical protein
MADILGKLAAAGQSRCDDAVVASRAVWDRPLGQAHDVPDGKLLEASTVSA